MKCITVYTSSFEQFSDIYEEVVTKDLVENEDLVIEEVTVSNLGHVDAQHIERMRLKPEVVVMRDKARKYLILQHGDVFEICIPTEEDTVVKAEEEIEA